MGDHQGPCLDQGLKDGVLGSAPSMLAGREPMDFKSNLPKLSTCSLRNLAKERIWCQELSVRQGLTDGSEISRPGTLGKFMRMFDIDCTCLRTGTAFAVLTTEGTSF